MAEVIVVNPRETDPYLRVRAALTDTRDLMERIGELMEAEALGAFDEGQFGDFKWPEQYPNQGIPFLHVAGAIQDFADGRSEPKARRLERKKPLFDTGALSQSPKHRVTGPKTVEVGSTHPAAATHQWGLTSSIPLEKQTKSEIAKWLLTKAGAAYTGKLARALMPSMSSWDTQVAQRPFLGVPKRLEKEIVETVEREIAEAGNRGAG